MISIAMAFYNGKKYIKDQIYSILENMQKKDELIISVDDDSDGSREILTELNLDFYEAKVEAAFYGPKLDVQIKTAIGHDVTISTCQLDFLLPQRFELEYIGEDGKAHRPIVIHRVIFGSIERFIGR